MDTGDLSEQTYRAILMEAERFNHDLTLQFGLMSYSCSDEDDFMKNSEQLVQEMLRYDEFDVDDIFFGNPPEMKHFHIVLNKILENISEVKKIPAENRIYFYN